MPWRMITPHEAFAIYGESLTTTHTIWWGMFTKFTGLEVPEKYYPIVEKIARKEKSGFNVSMENNELVVTASLGLSVDHRDFIWEDEPTIEF